MPKPPKPVDENRERQDRYLERQGLLNYQTKGLSQAQIAERYRKAGVGVNQDWFKQQYGNRPQGFSDGGYAPDERVPIDYSGMQPTNQFGGAPVPTYKDQLRARYAPALTYESTATRRLGYVPTFGQDPKEVAKAYQLLKATPKGTPLPEWMQGQEQQIEEAYKWFEFRNKGAPFSEWKYLDAKDPGLQYLGGIQGPPLPKQKSTFATPDQFTQGQATWQDIAPDERKRILSDPNFDITKIPTRLQQQLLSDPNFDWSRLPKWQKIYYDLSSNPATMGAAQGALLGLGGGGPVGSLAGGALGGGLGYAAAKTGYDPTKEFWEQGNKLAGAFGFMNFLAEQAEKTVGFGVQALGAATGQNDLSAQELFTKETWNAGAMAFETLAPALQAATREWNNNKWDVKDILKVAPPIWVASQIVDAFANPENYKGAELYLGRKDPLELESTFYERINEARERIKAGESYRQVMIDLQTGIVAQVGDMAGQAFADPLNVLPTTVNKLGGKIAEVGGHEVAARAFAETGAPIEAARRYKTLVQAGDVPANFDYQNMGSMARWVAGLTEQGGIKAGGLTKQGLLDRPVDTSKAGILTRLKEDWGSLTPEARAREGATMFYNNIGTLFSMFDDPQQIGTYLRSLSNGNMEVAKEMGGKIANSPEWYTVLPALKEFNTEKVDGLLAAWDLAQPKRDALLKIADVLGEQPGKFVEDLAKRGSAEQDFQRVRGRLEQSKSPQAKQLLDQIQRGEFTPDHLQDIVNAFTGDGAMYWHPDQFKAAALDALGAHFDEWTVDRLGLDEANKSAFFRTTHLLKSAQSVLLLGGSPGYALTNGLSNMVHRAATGIYGYMTTRQIDTWLDRFGVKPARLEEGVGMGGIVEQAKTRGGVQTEAIEKAIKGNQNDALGRAQRMVSAIGKKMPFNKLSSWFESTESRQGTMIAMKDMWQRTWKRGVGFSEMPTELRSQVQAAGINPGTIYSLIEAGMSKAEVEKFIFSRTEGIMARSLVSDAAQRMGIAASDAGAMLEKVGVLDELDTLLSRADSPDKVRSAFRQAVTKAQDWNDMQTGRDLKAMAENVTNKVNAEGAAAALDVVQHANGEYFDAWMDHFYRFGDVFEDLRLIDDPELRSRAIEENYKISDAEFRRINARTAANYQGIFEAWGRSGHPDALKMLSAIGESDAAMKRAYDFMRETRKAFFERNKDAFDATEWNAGKKNIDQAFKQAFEQKKQAEVRMGEALGKIHEDIYGPAAGEAARLWWEDVIKFSDDIVQRERKFRDSLEGMNKDQREAAKQKYYSTDKIGQIAELERINQEGIQRLQRTIRGSGGGAPTPTPTPTQPRPPTPTEPTTVQPTAEAPINVTDEINNLAAQAEQRRAATQERMDQSISVAEEFGYGARDQYALMSALRKYGDADIASWDDPRLTPEYMRETLQKRADFKAEQQAQREQTAVERAVNRVYEEAIQKPRSELPPPLSDAIASEAVRIADVISGGEPGRKLFSEEGFIGVARSTYPKWYNDLQASVGGRKKLLAALDKIVEDAGRDKGKVVERVKDFLLTGMRFGDQETGNPPNLNVLAALGADDATMLTALNTFNDMMRTDFTLEQVLRPDAEDFIPNYEAALAETEPVFDSALWQKDMDNALQAGDLTTIIDRIEQLPEGMQDRTLPTGETYRDYMSRVFDETAARVEQETRDTSIAEAAARADDAISDMETHGDAVMTRRILEEKFKDVFDLTDEQAGAYMELSDSIAGWFERTTGENGDAFYSRYYEDVVQGGEGDLFQIEPINRRMSVEETSNYARALVRQGADELRRAVVNENVKADRIAILNEAHKINPQLAESVARKVSDQLFQEAFGQTKKGAVTFDADGIKATIHAFEAKDFSTLVHENAHVFRRMLADVANRTDNKQVKADLSTIEEWAGAKDGQWTRDAEEKFARGFEKYIADGKAPTPKLKRAFESFKTWMLQVYKQISGSAIDVKLSDDVRAVFDRMVGEEKPVKEKVVSPKKLVRVLTFEEFAAQRYGATRLPMAEEFQRMPRATKIDYKRAGEEILRRFAENDELNTQAHAEYDRLLSEGRIRPPSEIEKMARTAEGHPDNESVQAARRLLEKRFAKTPSLAEQYPDIYQKFGTYNPAATFDLDSPNALFQDANMPFGTMDNASGFKADSEWMDAGYRQKVKPLLDAMQDTAIDRFQNERPLDGAMRDLSPEGQKMLRQYIKGVQNEMGSAKLSTMKWGESQRDFAMLNYNRRYGFDKFFEVGVPYQFFYTRSLMTWGMRALDKPSWFANYARLRNQQNRYERDIPERLRNKIKIPAPWMPDWMGDALYIDPLANLFTPSNFLRPFEQSLKDTNYQQIEAERILQEWSQDESVSQDEIMQAVQTRSGSIWERALAEAGIRRESEISNPFDFMATMFGPAWYLSTPLNMAGVEVPFLSKGEPGKVSTTPLLNTTRAFQSVTKGTWAEPIGQFVGLLGKPEEMLRKKYNLPEFGEYGDYYIDRQLANMVADGLINSQEAQTAMIERQGDLFEQARERVKMELAMRVPLMGTVYAGTHEGLGAGAQAFLPSLFGSGLLPAGELEYRGLKQEWNAAWKEYDGGNKQAVTDFFDEHPEYEAYLAKGKKPEERLRSFLIGQIWDGYMELGETNKKLAGAEMGEEFKQSFLDKETRSYDTLSVDQLTAWAQMLGQMTPKAPAISGQPSAISQPSMQAPKLDLYSPEVTQVTDQFFRQRKEKYNDYYMLEQGYYSLPKSQRGSYLRKFPRLKEYWNWKDDWYESYPDLKPIFQGKVFKRVDTSAWPMGLENYVTMYAMTGDRLPKGASLALEQVWIREGQPYGDYKTWLDAQVAPAMLYQTGGQ